MVKRPATHTAYAIKWERGTHPRSPRVAHFLEIGDAHVESAVKSRHPVRLDRLPIGGFDGRVFLVPIGEKPEDFAAQLTGLSEEEVDV
jgi:hypothetical protein